MNLLQKIAFTIIAHNNSSQELWVGLRDFMVANCALRQSGVLRDVEDFCFASFDSELRQVDNLELFLAIWLYAFYSTIYASAFGTIPAGVLGIASLGVGLTVGEYF